MVKPEGIIHKLYTSFQVKDWKSMQSCYHPEATFTDPVFRNLAANETRAMWHMLAGSAQDLKVLFGDVAVEDSLGRCRWQAWYTFSRTGRSVHNVIDASFEFKDGLIFRHVDRFDLWRWSKMAFGTAGSLLGWTPFFQGKIRKTARKSLIHFMTRHPAYEGELAYRPKS
jgi:SnoaL-like domain